jgi:hypothetical protein
MRYGLLMLAAAGLWSSGGEAPYARLGDPRIPPEEVALMTKLLCVTSKTGKKYGAPLVDKFKREDGTCDAWAECQASRDRNAIYAYLIAVYDLVAWWTAEGREIDRACRALCLQRLKVSDREDPFGAIIRCTADPAKADKRTRSKWSRLMRYAALYKLDSEPLEPFLRRKGGINACAARFTRCLGRLKPACSPRHSARG